MKKFLVFCFSFFPCLVLAANQPPSAEVMPLLQQIAQSSCQFNRNGDWFSGAEAAKHIEKKYHYFVEKNKIHSTEDFIRLAASKSEMSGKAYLIKCGGQPVSELAPWLTQALGKLRQAK